MIREVKSAVTEEYGIEYEDESKTLAQLEYSDNQKSEARIRKNDNSIEGSLHKCKAFK